MSCRWLRGGRSYSGQAYFENDVSRSLFWVRQFGLFKDFNASGLGERESFYGGWELRHGWTENRDSIGVWKNSRFIYEL